MHCPVNGKGHFDVRDWTCESLSHLLWDAGVYDVYLKFILLWSKHSDSSDYTQPSHFLSKVKPA